MNLIKVTDGQWRLDVKHRLTSEILTLFSYYDDGEANPYERFDSDFLIKLQSLQEDAFALKNIYIQHALSWCKDGMKELDSYAELNALSDKGLNFEKLLNDDYIEIQKWVNITFSASTNNIDIYIDGKLVRTCLLPGVASVNNNANVYITPNGGFDGWTSKFQYYPNSLNPQEAWNIYTQGYSNWFTGFNYKVQISLVENGNTQSSITI
jgi:hypothetical protein